MAPGFLQGALPAPCSVPALRTTPLSGKKKSEVEDLTFHPNIRTPSPLRFVEKSVSSQSLLFCTFSRKRPPDRGKEHPAARCPGRCLFNDLFGPSSACPAPPVLASAVRVAALFSTPTSALHAWRSEGTHLEQSPGLFLRLRGAARRNLSACHSRGRPEAVGRGGSMWSGVSAFTGGGVGHWTSPKGVPFVSISFPLFPVPLAEFGSLQGEYHLGPELQHSRWACEDALPWTPT